MYPHCVAFDMRICFQVGVYCNYVTTGAGLVEQMGLEGACMEHRKYLRRGSRVWLECYVKHTSLLRFWQTPMRGQGQHCF